MKPIESEGPTVADAVEAALSQSGLRRDQVEVAVLEEGAAGFLGIGAKPARVRLTEKRWGPDSPAPETPPASRPARAASTRRSAPPAARPAPPAPRSEEPRRPAPRPEPVREKREPVRERREPARQRREPPARERRESVVRELKPLTPAETQESCSKAEGLVTELLKMMKVAAPTVTASWDPSMERVKAVVESQDASSLVGRDGRVLESLQFLTTLMLSRAGNTPVAVQVDALSYWEKREQAILEEARRAVENVRATGKPYRLEPMDSSMRRIIHRTYATSTDITTASEGEGPWRKIVVRPRNG